MTNADPWYKYILPDVYDKPLRIKTMRMDAIEFIKADDDDNVRLDAIEIVEDNLDYNFYTDEVIELERMVDPIAILPQDNLRYSIINILAYCIGKMLEDVMDTYTKSINTYGANKKNWLIIKNEFLFKRMLLTDGKKNYATIQEMQEGNMIPQDINSMDIKGLAMQKSTVNEATQEALQRVLYEDILNCKDIDQIKVIKKLALIEKNIFKSLQSGSKEYYKPVSVKSVNSYDDPMRIQGIKASVAWNALKDPDMETIDLQSSNALDVVKVDMNRKNMDRIKDSYPTVYERLKNLLENDKHFKGEISAIAIPLDSQVPEWIKEFIDYNEIMNNNIGNFKKPLEALGIQMAQSGNSNYTNILRI